MRASYFALTRRIVATTAAAWGHATLLSRVASPLLPTVPRASCLALGCRIAAADVAVWGRCSAPGCRNAVAAWGHLPCSRVSPRRSPLPPGGHLAVPSRATSPPLPHRGTLPCSGVSHRRLRCRLVGASRHTCVCHVAAAAAAIWGHPTVLSVVASPPLPLPCVCGVHLSTLCSRHMGASRDALKCRVAASAVAMGGISPCSCVSPRHRRHCHMGASLRAYRAVWV